MRFVRTTAVAAAAVTGAAVLTAGVSAQAAATPGWRVVASVPKLSSDDILHSTSASSWYNIWAVGNADQSGNSNGVGLALRWAGTSWKRITAPSGTNEFNDVSANSSTNTWLTGRGTHNVFRWNNGKWSSYQFANEVPQSIVGTGGTQAWLATGGLTSTTTTLRHYTGGAWHTASSPAFTNITAFANGGASDIWAVGSEASGDTTDTFAMHWNGSKWTDTGVPSYSVYGNPASLNSIAVLSKNNVWAAGNVAMEPQATPVPILVHWNGKTWTKTSVPAIRNALIRGIVKDNTGGIFLLRGDSTVQRRTSSGTYSTETLPAPAKGRNAEMAGLAHVPSTTHTLIVGGTYPEPSDSLIYINR